MEVGESGSRHDSQYIDVAYLIFEMPVRMSMQIEAASQKSVIETESIL